MGGMIETRVNDKRWLETADICLKTVENCRYLLETRSGARKRVLAVERKLMTVGNCCGTMKMCSVTEKRVILLVNESGQPKMAENACC